MYILSVLKNEENIYRSNVKMLLLSFTLISDVYKPFIPNKTTFNKYRYTQWISKLPGELCNPLSKVVPISTDILSGFQSSPGTL